MKDFKDILNEIGFHPSHMTEEHYHEIIEALENLTDSLRDAHYALSKYQLDKEIAIVEKAYNSIGKKTMAFSKKYGKQFGARALTGLRPL